jgi:hypothetical protein
MAPRLWRAEPAPQNQPSIRVGGARGLRHDRRNTGQDVLDGEGAGHPLGQHLVWRDALPVYLTKTDHRTLGQGDGAKRHASFPSANKTERLASLCSIIPLTNWTRRIVRVWYAVDQLCPALRMSAGVQLC